MALKFISRSEKFQAYEAKTLKEFDWELARFALEVIALVVVVYAVHLLIHNYLFF